MAVLPDWVATTAKPIKGLDLLGLRSPVQQIGNVLLDGVTSVTPRIRYVAFTAWLADRFRRSGLNDSTDDWRQFAARQEAALVISNLLRDQAQSGLVGPLKAKATLESSGKTVPLNPLTKISATTIYANPSEQLKLLQLRGPRVPALTVQRGLPLAQAVERALTATSYARRLMRNPQLQTIARAELEELASVSAIDRPTAEERTALVNALVPLEPTTQNEGRRALCYALFLYLAAERQRLIAEDDVFGAALEPPGRLPACFAPVVDGWLRYAARDLVAVCHEAVLDALHTQALALNGGGAVSGEEVISNLLAKEEEHDALLRELNLLRTREAARDLDFAELLNRVTAVCAPLSSSSRPRLRRWQAPLSEPHLARVALGAGPAALVLLPVALSMLVARLGTTAEPPPADADPTERSLLRPLWGRLGVIDVLLPETIRLSAERVSMPKAMARLARRTLDQHLRIAWARAGVDPTRDVALFVVEGDHWLPRQDWARGQTLSRLSEAIGWLVQLRLIGDEGITQRGNSILERVLSGSAH